MYVVQLYKEDWTILHMLGCWAVALPSTKQIVCCWGHGNFIFGVAVCMKAAVDYLCCLVVAMACLLVVPPVVLV